MAEIEVIDIAALGPALPIGIAFALQGFVFNDRLGNHSAALQCRQISAFLICKKQPERCHNHRDEAGHQQKFAGLALSAFAELVQSRLIVVHGFVPGTVDAAAIPRSIEALLMRRPMNQSSSARTSAMKIFG